ncbi:MAG: preprotein translocase subunit SecG [Planctomycetota bacterium]|nr:preprotein translocase subunit SecG [Planctomycetota bacterium]
MSVLFLIIFFFISFLIVGIILLQEGKGGGLTGMSTGMDGVMGARNPLRRMTTWLFVIFVLLTISINYYFFKRGDVSIPSGIELPAQQTDITETVPASGPLVIEADTAAVTPAETTVPEAPTASVETTVPEAPTATAETPPTE